MIASRFCQRLVLKLRSRCNRTARRFGAAPKEFFLIGECEVRIEHRQTRTDLEAIHQCLWQKQYEIPEVRGDLRRAPDAYFLRLVRNGKTPLIIDGGANIGASAVWFAARFPGAHIIAIEPSRDNCRILRQNTRSYDVDVREVGISARGGIANLIDPGYGEWAYRTEVTGSGIEVRMTTLSSILSEHDLDKYVPFILKLDIEGSESEMFDGAENPACLFPIIIIEPHDWMLPTRKTSSSFFRFHVERDRDFMSRGENVFSIDYGLLTAAAGSNLIKDATS